MNRDLIAGMGLSNDEIAATRYGFIESALPADELSALLPEKPRYQSDPF